MPLPSLCSCSSDEPSWKRATELLVEVASHGEVTGFEVPCLIIAAKDDLDPFPMAIQDSTRVLFCLVLLFVENSLIHICRTAFLFLKKYLVSLLA